MEPLRPIGKSRGAKFPRPSDVGGPQNSRWLASKVPGVASHKALKAQQDDVAAGDHSCVSSNFGRRRYRPLPSLRISRPADLEAARAEAEAAPVRRSAGLRSRPPRRAATAASAGCVCLLRRPAPSAFADGAAALLFGTPTLCRAAPRACGAAAAAAAAAGDFGLNSMTRTVMLSVPTCPKTVSAVLTPAMAGPQADMPLCLRACVRACVRCIAYVYDIDACTWCMQAHAIHADACNKAARTISLSGSRAKHSSSSASHLLDINEAVRQHHAEVAPWRHAALPLEAREGCR